MRNFITYPFAILYRLCRAGEKEGEYRPAVKKKERKKRKDRDSNPSLVFS